MLVFRIADDDSCVVELKYGMPPEVTAPETVIGNALLALIVFHAHVATPDPEQPRY
jgi:hypothetical protein